MERETCARTKTGKSVKTKSERESNKEQSSQQVLGKVNEGKGEREK